MAKQLREFSRQSTQRRSADLNNSNLVIEEDLEDEFKEILSSIVNEDYIVSVTGIKDLSKVEYVSLQIDTKEQALYDLSEILPNLKHLVLDNSHIGSIRDLGTGMRLITSLSLSGCNLRDLDGIGVLIGLQELCLSDNLLSDISPLTLHENLENLNLTNNRISDLTFGVVLASCPKLRSLFLCRNPVEKLTKYRPVVTFLLPNLEMLDGTPLDNSNISKYASSLMDEAQDELNLIQEELDEELRLDDNIFEDAINNKDGDRSFMIPIGTSPRLAKGQIDSLPDTGSELTHGSSIVLAGNMAAAMRKRRVGGDSLNDSSLAVEENETTLDILDNALRAKTPTTRSNSDKLSFIAEGDITEIILGSPQRKPHIANSPARPLSTKGVVKHSTTSQNVSMSFDAESSLHDGGRRPKSAFSGSSLRYSDKSYEKHHPSKTNTPEKDDNRAPSPRQRNSSRPQSAAVSPAEVTSLFHERNLPFVVSRANLHDHDGSDGSDEEAPKMRDIMVKREIKETPKDILAAKGTAGSLVHQNLVRRFKSDSSASSKGASSSPSSILKKPLPSIGDDFHISDDSDEDEELAVNHSDRLKFMISKKDDKIATLHKSRQATLKKLQGQDLLSEDIVQVKSNEKPPRSASTANSSSVADKSEISSSVEKKLGFNLAGSLAAIDKWVQDVDSDDGDDSESDKLNKQSISTNNSRALPTVADQLTKSSISNRPPSGKDKILSRDAIFNLCWNASEKRPDSRSSSRPSSGARKSSVSSLGSEVDGSVLSESEYPSNKSEKKKKTPTNTVRRTVAADYVENATDATPKSSSVPSSHNKSSNHHHKEPLPKQQEATALNMSDFELVELLKKPPKTVIALRTKASFQEFFRGIDMDRFKRLLFEAYADIPDLKDRESKIARRMSLMEGS